MDGRSMLYVALIFCVAVEAVALVPGSTSDNQTHKPVDQDEASRQPRKKQLIEKLKTAVEKEKKDDGRGQRKSADAEGRPDVLQDLDVKIDEPSSEVNPATRSKKSSSLYNVPMSSPSQTMSSSSLFAVPMSSPSQTMTSGFYTLPTSAQMMSIHGLQPPGASIEIRPHSCYQYSGAAMPYFGGQSALSLTHPVVRMVDASPPRMDNGQLGVSVAAADADQRWAPMLLACQPQQAWPSSSYVAPPMRNCMVQLLAAERRPTASGFKKSVGDVVEVNASTSAGEVADAAVRQLSEDASRELGIAAADDQAVLPWPASPTSEELVRHQAALRAEQQERLNQWTRLGQQLSGVAAVDARSSLQPHQTIVLTHGSPPTNLQTYAVAPTRLQTYAVAPTNLQTPYSLQQGAVVLGNVGVPLQSSPVVVQHHQASPPVITISSG